jgi:hypothetical protein
MLPSRSMTVSVEIGKTVAMPAGSSERRQVERMNGRMLRRRACRSLIATNRAVQPRPRRCRHRRGEVDAAACRGVGHTFGTSRFRSPGHRPPPSQSRSMGRRTLPSGRRAAFHCAIVSAPLASECDTFVPSSARSDAIVEPVLAHHFGEAVHWSNAKISTNRMIKRSPLRRPRSEYRPAARIGRPIRLDHHSRHGTRSSRALLLQLACDYSHACVSRGSKVPLM